MTKRKYIKPPDSRECEWRAGPPPEIGWWPADWGSCPNPVALRWWNGSAWSDFAFANDGADYAASAAQRKVVSTSIRWADRWWAEK